VAFEIIQILFVVVENKLIENRMRPISFSFVCLIDYIRLIRKKKPHHLSIFYTLSRHSEDFTHLPKFLIVSYELQHSGIIQVDDDTIAGKKTDLQAN
jgi:hypothetical protein